MENRDDDLLDRLLSGESPEARDTRLEDAWNVLVQVLLPLVLVLTFVIITGIQAYKRAAETFQKILEEDGKIAELKTRDLEADVQLQKLLRALEEAKAEQRGAFGLNLFPEPGRVRRSGTRVADEDFRRLCGRARDVLGDGSPRALSAEAGRLYAEILRKAGVIDPAGIEVQRWAADSGGLGDVGRFSSSPGTITAANRRQIHNLILDSLTGLEQEVVDLQVGLVSRIFSELLTSGSVGDLDQDSARMLDEIIDPAIPEKVRRARAAELYRRVLRHWHDQLEEDRYPLLEKSWAQLQA